MLFEPLWKFLQLPLPRLSWPPVPLWPLAQALALGLLAPRQGRSRPLADRDCLCGSYCCGIEAEYITEQKSIGGLLFDMLTVM